MGEGILNRQVAKFAKERGRILTTEDAEDADEDSSFEG